MKEVYNPYSVQKSLKKLGLNRVKELGLGHRNKTYTVSSAEDLLCYAHSVEVPISSTLGSRKSVYNWIWLTLTRMILIRGEFK